MLTKTLQYLNRIKVPFILTVLLISSLISIFFILYSNQKTFFTRQMVQGKVLLTDLNSDLNISEIPKINTAKNDSIYKTTLKNIDENSKKTPEIKIKLNSAEQASKQTASSTLLNNPETNGDLAAVRPKIALIVGNLGLAKQETIKMLEADSRIALGFSPYSQDASEWINKGVASGHEVYINIPMHPTEYPANDAGSLALMNNLSSEENLLRLNSVISKSNKIKGVVSPGKEIFTDSKDDILPILEFLKKNNLAFIYSGEVNNENLDKLSQKLNLDYMDINIVIDDELDPDAVRSNLLRLENMAKVRGFAVGKFHAYPMSVNIINEWIKESDKAEVMLVPISQLFEYHNREVKDRNKIIESDNKGSTDESHVSENSRGKNNNIYTKEEYNEYFDTSNKVTYVKEGENNALNPPDNKEKKGDKEEVK